MPWTRALPHRSTVPEREVGRRASLVVALAVVLGAIALPGSPVLAGSTDCDWSTDKVEKKLLSLVNRARDDAGLRALDPASDLEEVARDWSETMADSGDFKHRPKHSDAYPSRFGGGGENIQARPGGPKVAGPLHDAWMDSSGHRKNLLNDRHTHVGIAVACDDDGRVYATQNFATAEGGSGGPRTAPASSAFPDACPTGLRAAARFTDSSAHGAHGAAIACMRTWEVAIGYADGTYRPDGTATRAQFAGALHRLLDRAGKAPEASGSGSFRDIGGDHPQADAIEALADAGIVNGAGSSRFAPDGRVTRGQMASLLAGTHRTVFGRHLPKSGTDLGDIAGTTHESAIRRLVGGGITVGFPDGTFRPDEAVTRGQLASFHARYADLLVEKGLAKRPG